MQYKIEELNKEIAEGRLQNIVNLSEFALEREFETLMRIINSRVVSSDSYCTILQLTGPSASGKTTFAKRLTAQLAEDGATTHLLSLDDFYQDIRLTQKEQLAEGFVPGEGKDYDYERLDAFDVDKFKATMNDFISGKPTEIPKFDFNVGRPNGIRKTIQRTGKDIIVLEGIQALAKELTEDVSFDNSFKLYICPFDTFSLGGERVIGPKEIRFMRRAIRDYYTRSAKITRTMEMWPNVRIGEERDIKPRKKDAIFIYNSANAYELSYLAPKILEISKDITKEERAALNEILPLEILEKIVPAQNIELPNNAIFGEFYFG